MTENTERMMTLDQAKALRVGDRVTVLVCGRGDVDEDEFTFEPGTILTVCALDTFAAPQGLAVTVVSPSGVVNVFDEGDYGGRYPFAWPKREIAGMDLDEICRRQSKGKPEFHATVEYRTKEECKSWSGMVRATSMEEANRATRERFTRKRGVVRVDTVSIR
jgi:hypothetical protein